MCTYLNRTGSKSYFRRPIPKDLIGHFKTETGGVRREWKYSLGVTDRGMAKPLMRPYEIETDRLILEARSDPLGSPSRQGTAQDGQTRSRPAASQAQVDETEREGLTAAEFFYRVNSEEEARADNDPAFREDRNFRAARVRARRKLEELEGDAELLRELKTGRIESLLELYDRYAGVSGRHPKTIAQWRPYIRKLTEFIGEDNVHAVTHRKLVGLIGSSGGARMTGGGFGGAVVAMIPEEMCETVAEQVRETYRTPQGRKPEILVETASSGASIIEMGDQAECGNEG